MSHHRSAALQHVTYLGFVLLTVILTSCLAAPLDSLEASDSIESFELIDSFEREYRSRPHDAQPLSEDELLLEFFQYLEHVASKHVSDNSSTTTTTTEEPSAIFDNLVLGNMMKKLIARYHRQMRSSGNHDSDEEHHHHHDDDKSEMEESDDHHHHHDDDKSERDSEMEESDEDSSTSSALQTAITAHREQAQLSPRYAVAISTTERADGYNVPDETSVRVGSTARPTEKTSIRVSSTARPTEKTSIRASSTARPTEKTSIQVTSTARPTEKTSREVSSTTHSTESSTHHVYQPAHNGSSNFTSKAKRENSEQRVYHAEIPPPPYSPLVAQHTVISKASLFKQTTQVAAILAGIMVVGVVAGYLGLLSWRIIERKRNGNRQRLVDESDENDIRLYEL